MGRKDSLPELSLNLTNSGHLLWQIGRGALQLNEPFSATSQEIRFLPISKYSLLSRHSSSTLEPALLVTGSWRLMLKGEAISSGGQVFSGIVKYLNWNLELSVRRKSTAISWLSIHLSRHGEQLLLIYHVFRFELMRTKSPLPFRAA